ncbi:cilia- and flagella- associated protein 210-like [Uloborus diversus]|uniref:cilia- and flagella- associated protein 210-like n=1 Tax=Uloborus diversus TaxID=327109 RepID=UPI0024090BFE|nr:cilia- and flagella- associated protein 210-like [Uloborus diversus]
MKHKNSLDEQIAMKQKLLNMMDKLDDAEEQRRKLFNDTKREIKLQHQQVKAELDEKKDGLRKYVAETLRDEKASIKAKEEEILQKAIREKEAKRKEDIAIKRIDRQEAMDSIQKFYENELESKQRRKLEERRTAFRERRQIIDKVEQLKKTEDDVVQKRQDLKDEARHLQLHQIAKKNEVKKREEMEKIREYMGHMRSLDQEEEMFQKYAQAEIADCESRGLDTRAMRKIAKPGIECGKGPLFEKRGQIRPKYYASVANPDDLPHTKKIQKKIDTKSRLGFMLP